jgi:hypothetical protein
MASFAERLLRALGRALARQQGSSKQRPTPTPSAPSKGQTRSRASKGRASDFRGTTTITYDPHADDRADPGEIVWTWVPYEDQPSRGKDRPVLLIGWDEQWLLGLMLTSKDHDRDADDEAFHGRYWMDLGTGDWDSHKRPSEVRLDRILRIRPDSVRREGAILDRRRFDAVARAVKEIKGW